MGFSRLAYGVLVPAMRHALGGSYAVYGAIGTANLAGYLCGALSATRLARGTDRPRSNAVALAGMCAAMAACAFVREPLLLGMLRFAVGAFSGVALTLTLALAVERVPPQRRGFAAAIVWGGGSLGVAVVGVSGLVLSATDPLAWRGQWLAMAAIGAVAALAFARTTGGAFAAAEYRDDGAPLGMFRRTAYLPLTIAYFAYGFGYINVLTFLGAALGSGFARSAAPIWIVLGVAGTAGAVLWGPLVDRFRDGRPVALAAACCAAGAVAVASGVATLAFAGALAIGVSFIGVPAMIGALLQQREPAHRYPRAFATITLALGAAQILGPLAGGLIADRAGAAGALTLGAAALALAALFAARYRTGGVVQAASQTVL